MKLLLLVNPAASAVTTRSRVEVENILAADHDVSLAVTSGRDHATELARQAASEGTAVVAVLGGDGTMNEVANGLVGSSTALAPLPGGSTSVFARTLGFPNHLPPAAKQLSAALQRGSRRRVELGTANGRHYLFNLGAGFDAEVVEHVESHGALKRAVGQAAFVYSAIAAWLDQTDRSRPHMSVKVSGEDSIHVGKFVLCLNTNPYTFLGRRALNVAPGTGFGTGLAVAVLHDLRLGTLGRAMRCVFGDGHDLGRQPGVTVRTDVETVTVSADKPFPHQTDGEFLGRVDALEVGLIPSCLDVVPP